MGVRKLDLKGWIGLIDWDGAGEDDLLDWVGGLRWIEVWMSV